MSELQQFVGSRVVANDGVNCTKGDRGTIVSVNEHWLKVDWDGKGTTTTDWLSIELEGDR